MREGEGVDSHVFVVCADQVAECEGDIRQKPTCRSQLTEWLRDYLLEGKSVSTHSAVVVFSIPDGKEVEGLDTATVSFTQQNYSQDNMVELLAGEAALMGCCGGFAVDIPPMESLVSSVEGDITSVVGLPLLLLEKLLRECSK
eukprot:GHVR01107878.1.p1 GENE.GHVR01107878.1~~GHVR01107878.1.p1  ORF type:complete len:143 (+),score=37.93 GHVR01107878.1:293-721(+)